MPPSMVADWRKLFPDLEEQRALRDSRGVEWARQAPAMASEKRISIVRTTNAVSCVHLVPNNLRSDHPVALLHGGGWVFNSPEQSIGIARLFADLSGRPVFSIGYRRAPEHPFPTPLDDVTAALRALLSGQIEDLNPEGVLLTGFSAGANLAVGSCLSLRDAGAPLPHEMVLYYGVYGLTFDRPDHVALDTDPEALTIAKMNNFVRAYGVDHAPSPLADNLSADLAGMPQCRFLCGDSDILLGDTLAFYSRCRAAGVTASLEVLPGQKHGFADRWSEDPDVMTSHQKNFGAY